LRAWSIELSSCHGFPAWSISTIQSTNVDATLKALDAFPEPAGILGGKTKGCDYTILRKSLRQHARWSAADRRRRGQD